MKCPKCQKRYKNEDKKELVSDMYKQPTTALNYIMMCCPKCGHKVFIRED